MEYAPSIQKSMENILNNFSLFTSIYLDYSENERTLNREEEAVYLLTFPELQAELFALQIFDCKAVFLQTQS